MVRDLEGPDARQRSTRRFQVVGRLSEAVSPGVAGQQRALAIDDDGLDHAHLVLFTGPTHREELLTPQTLHQVLGSLDQRGQALKRRLNQRAVLRGLRGALGRDHKVKVTGTRGG
ncbi:hypothetical protein D3C71_1778730 [compost metagenome]